MCSRRLSDRRRCGRDACRSLRGWSREWLLGPAATINVSASPVQSRTSPASRQWPDQRHSAGVVQYISEGLASASSTRTPAPWPLKNTCSLLSITARATEMGCRKPWVPVTAPAISGGAIGNGRIEFVGAFGGEYGATSRIEQGVIFHQLHHTLDHIHGACPLVELLLPPRGQHQGVV